MKRSKATEQPRVKCIVPICTNYYSRKSNGKVAKGDLDFFNVPSTGHLVYGKWCALLQLSGRRTEKICSVHFRRTDFIENIRLKMKDNAVPSVRLAAPVQGKQLKFGAICCVDGCFTKTRSSLTRFPGKTRLREAWYRALGIDDCDRVANLMVCHRHFKSSDFRKVISLYLRPCAVPSRRMRIPKSQIPAEERSSRPSYTKKMRSLAKSNAICFVPGCNSRTIAGISLHHFPAENDRRYWQWIENMKITKTPTKNSKVCSLHFEKASYILGGKNLKKIAVPTILQPDTSTIEKLVTAASDSEKAVAIKQDHLIDAMNYEVKTKPEPLIDAMDTEIKTEPEQLIDDVMNNEVNSEPEQDPLAEEDEIQSYLRQCNFQPG
ncbi:hypothetical protein RP20_CCG005145 [Aedes albopictus]|nr:hypothetical protein RP20_CCG005145 [Aedes albopictus]